jgi:hypothetical protein
VPRLKRVATVHLFRRVLQKSESAFGMLNKGGFHCCFFYVLTGRFAFAAWDTKQDDYLVASSSASVARHRARGFDRLCLRVDTARVVGNDASNDLRFSRIGKTPNLKR